MPAATAISEFNALDLLKEWKKIVNSNALAGRDGHLFKEFLKQASPIQIVLGMYQHRNEKSLSVPTFLSNSGDWLVADENKALIELAICMIETAPSEYWIWCDYRDEESAYAEEQTKKALGVLLSWARRIVG